MNEIQSILAVLSPNEKRQFVTFLKERNRRKSVKNLELLKLLERGNVKDMDLELYGTSSRSAYAVLVKRLKDTLVEFLANQAFLKESSEEADILKLLLASRTLFEQGVFRVGIKILEKAEKRATYVDNYAILNEIFQTKMQYAYLNPKWEITSIIKAFEANQKLHQRDIHLNMAYAIIKNEMNNPDRESLTNLIERVFKDFSLQINSDLTYKSLYQLMTLTASSAKLQNDFYAISSYMVEIFETMRSKGSVPQKYEYYYLSMLYLMAVTEFRNKKFQASQALLETIRGTLVASKKNYEQVFDEKVNVLQALNELYTGHIEVAEELLMSIKNPSLNWELALLLCLFQQQKFKETYAVFLKLNKSDDWYERKMGWTWVLKKNIIEILLLIELDKLDLVLNRLERFKRRFSKKLVAINEERVLRFIDLVKRYYEHPEQVKNGEFQTEIENSFEFIGREQEDLFVMSFFCWLRSKLENKNLYEVTLEQVEL